MIQNPILPGFHPDPCIVRVGEDYYLAVSSFEWFPGIPLYHSKDLKNWELVDYALKSVKYADLTGERASKGVWAPCLSYCEKEKRFYVFYSNIHGSNLWKMDIDNFLIWADDIHGPWSDPVYVMSSGFDASLFHDGDKKWMVWQERDTRPQNTAHRPIVLQEFDIGQKRLVGKPIRLTYGFTEHGFTEGPHLYKHGEYYYLLTAEGGTGYGHGAAVGRSRNIEGPYEADPQGPILTSALHEYSVRENPQMLKPELYNPATVIQKAGHASLVETQTGEWYAVHLSSRPILPQKRCILGRETSIQKMAWTSDGWIRMEDGSNLAKDFVPEPKIAETPFPPLPEYDDFDKEQLAIFYNSPRNPITPDWASLVRRKSWLALRGRETLTSAYTPSIVARRLTAMQAQVTTKMDFHPETYLQTAGLTCYYDNEDYFCIYKSYDEDRGSLVLGIEGFSNGTLVETELEPIDIPDGTVFLRAEIEKEKLQFSYSMDGESFQKLGPVLDMTLLSDEGNQRCLFTGTYVGIFAQDMYRRESWAEFDFLEYKIL